MFEVIVSLVKTGHVERKLFDSRDEAERYAAAREDRHLNDPRLKPATRAKRSLRDLRTEIDYLEPNAILSLALAAAAARRAA